MTAPMRGMPRLSAIPASQNTAPVAEFRCLFTHDTRKKQKKWQDGFLKFHSFNSRVIVYDAARFAVGDTYYKDSNELREGDELMLDKGVMVEVSEPLGVTQTDLTPLFERKAKDSPQRNNAPGPQKPLPRPTIPASNPLRAASQLRHKSLNTLLGTPKGPIGKAVPIRSPYEERAEKENLHAEERATKRQKTTHAAPLQQTRHSYPVRETAPTEVPRPSTRPLQVPQSAAVTHPQPVPRSATVITLSSQPEADNIPSDVTLPCTPSKPESWARPAIATPAPAPKEPEPRQDRANPTPKLPKGKVPVPHVKAQQTPRPPPSPSSPPVSASNRIANVDFAIQPMSDPPQEPSPVQSPPEVLIPLQKRKTKSLKLSTGVKRGMLLCQSVPARRQDGPGEPSAPICKPKERVKNSSLQTDRSGPVPQNNGAAPQKGKVGGNGTTVDARRIAESECNDMTVTETEEIPLEILDDAPLKILDDPDLVHGFMDQQLLVTPSPPTLNQPTKPDSPKNSKHAKAASTKKTPKSRKRADDLSIEDYAPKRKKARVAQPKHTTAKPTRRNKAEKTMPVLSSPPSPAPDAGGSEVPSREASIAPSKPTNGRPRNVPTPLSTTKLAALSTGGFKKKHKKPQAQAPASEVTVPPPRPVTVALPPHPLRSSKNGPLMSTTELSALLQSGPKSMRLEDDPIEDPSQGENNFSPSKRSGGFKRTRSENDAPIPSTSEEWEQQNLPKEPKSLETTKPTVTVATKPKAGGLAALVKKTDPRRKFKRTQSLSIATGMANANAEEPEVVTPRVDDDVGPWSTEAFDLFDWKPPGKEWKVEGTKMRLVDVESDTDQGVGLLINGK